MNLNEFASEIARQEGLKLNLSIGQIKEVLRITLSLIRNMTFMEFVKLMNRVK